MPLLTAHADGCIRLWNATDGKFVRESNVQVFPLESLTTAFTCTDRRMIVVAGVHGHIRIIHTVAWNEILSSGAILTNSIYWKAHMLAISAVSFFPVGKDVIMSSSSDCCVRLWTFSGIKSFDLRGAHWDFW